jgi:hypothetical protein
MFQYQSQYGGLRNSILAELCRRTTEEQQLSGHVGGIPGRAQLPQRQQLQPERSRLAEGRPLHSTATGGQAPNAMMTSKSHKRCQSRMALSRNDSA